MADVVFRRDSATGLTIGTDGRWMLTVKDSERKAWNRIPAIISRVHPGMPVDAIIEDGRVILDFGADTWVGVIPDDALRSLATAFLPFVEAFGEVSHD